MAYLRTWEPVPASKQAVLTRLSQTVRDGSSRAAGQAVYQSNCEICHGENGEGTIGPSLNKDTFLSIVDNEYLYTAIVTGRPGTAMPAWKQLPVDDLVHLSTGQEISVASWVAGADIGKELYGSLCVGCHGPNGNDGWAVTLNNREFLAAATDGFLQATLARGRANTAMRPVAAGAGGTAELSLEDIHHLVAYVWSWAAPENRPAK